MQKLSRTRARGVIMKIKRMADYTELERVVLLKIWEAVKGTTKDALVRTIKSAFICQDRKFNFACDFQLVGEYLRVSKLTVVSDGKTLIPAEDLSTAKTVYQEIYL